MLGRITGAGGANIGAGPSMSTWSGAKPLPKKGKVLIGGAFALLLIAAAPAPKIVASLKGDFNGDGKVDRATIETSGGNFRLMARLAGLGPKGVFTIDKGQGGGEGLYLAPSKPGLYTPLCEEDDQRKCRGPIRVRYPAINFSGAEGASQEFTWDGKALKTIQQGV